MLINNVLNKVNYHRVPSPSKTGKFLRGFISVLAALAAGLYGLIFYIASNIAGECVNRS